MKVKKSKFVKFFIVVFVCVFGFFGVNAVVNADTYYEYEEEIDYEFSPLWEIDFINIKKDINYLFKPNHTFINGDYSTNIYSINSFDYMEVIEVDLSGELTTLENTFSYLFDNITFYSFESLSILLNNNWYGEDDDKLQLCNYNGNKYILGTLSGYRLIYAFDNFILEGGNILEGWYIYDNDYNIVQSGDTLKFRGFYGIINNQNYVLNFQLPYYPMTYDWNSLISMFLGTMVINSSGAQLDNKYVINELLTIDNYGDNSVSIVSYLDDWSMIDSISFIIENQYIRFRDWNNFAPQFSVYLYDQTLTRTITIADGIMYRENGSVGLGLGVPITENFNSSFSGEYIPIIPSFSAIYGNFNTEPNDIIFIEKMIITFSSNEPIEMDGGTSLMYYCPDKTYYNDNYTDLGTEIINRVADDNLTGNLANSINDFLAIEILPGLSFYGILLLAVAVPLLIWILKIFFGG